MIIAYFMKPNGSWMYEVARFEEGLTLTDSVIEESL